MSCVYVCVCVGGTREGGESPLAENQGLYLIRKLLDDSQPCLIALLLISSIFPTAVQVILYVTNYVPVTLIFHFFPCWMYTHSRGGYKLFFTKNPFHHHILSLTSPLHSTYFYSLRSGSGFIPLLQIFHVFLFCSSTHILFPQLHATRFLKMENSHHSLRWFSNTGWWVTLFLTPCILNEAPNTLHCNSLFIFHLPPFSGSSLRTAGFIHNASHCEQERHPFVSPSIPSTSAVLEKGCEQSSLSLEVFRLLGLKGDWLTACDPKYNIRKKPHFFQGYS